MAASGPSRPGAAVVARRAGGRGGPRDSRTLVAMVSAAAARYADYTDTDGRPRVVATVHSTLMTVALALMVVSLLLRVGGPVDRTVPVVLGILALLIVTAGAYVGGEVVYALGNMVDRHAWRAGGRKWTALDVTDVPEGTPTRAMAGTEALVLVRYGSTVHATRDLRPRRRAAGQACPGSHHLRSAGLRGAA